MTPFAQLGNSQMEKEALVKAVGAGLKGVGRFAKDLVNPSVIGMRASNPGVYGRIGGDMFQAARRGNFHSGMTGVGGQFNKLTRNLKADGKSLFANLRGQMQPGGIPTIPMKAPMSADTSDILKITRGEAWSMDPARVKALTGSVPRPLPSMQ